MASFLQQIGSWLGQNALGLFGFGSGIAQQQQNIRLMREQNQFNAEQASINRNFQAQQAQLARDYQTEFYETYQSPSAMVRQYQDAGMNPALMAGGYNPSTVSTSSPGGSQASGVNAPYQSMESMVNMVAQMAMIKANIENTKADTDVKRAEAFKLGSDVNLNNKQIENITQQIRESVARENSEYSKRDLNQVLQATESIKQENMSVEQYILKFEQEYIRKNGRKPDQPVFNILFDYLSPYLDVGSEFINDTAIISKKGYNLVKYLLGL